MPVENTASGIDNPEHSIAKNALMMTATLGRLALLPEMMDAIQERSITRTALMVGAAVVTDIGDGLLARKLNVDNNARRIADAIVDRTTIFTAFGTLIHQDPEYLAWYLRSLQEEVFWQSVVIFVFGDVTN